jgi:lipopolysaccharide transport system ATP-binding protein
MIDVRGISKSFKLYKKPSDRLKEIVLRKPFHERYAALADISFAAADGEAIGIIGRNGAGKSTLLKILTGVVIPDAGEIEISGKLTGLLELGTGFDMNLSGRQNIDANGLLIGMSPAEINQKTATILDFSELGRFIDEPLRTYSSGMVMRLAFSISIHADPDVFVVDEALSVGDAHFQQKCMRKIKEFKARGGSLLFVSHDANAVKMLCDRALVLNNGKLVVDSEPEQAVNIYNRLLAEDEDEFSYSRDPERGYGTEEVIIEKVEAIGERSRASAVSSGETLQLNIRLKGLTDIDNFTIGLMIRDRFGQDAYGTNSYYLNVPLQIKQGEIKHVRYDVPMHLAPGKYTVTLALHEGFDHTRHCYHWWDNACQFEVAGIIGHVFGGQCNLQARLVT